MENNAENAWEIIMKNRTTWCAVAEKGKFLGIVTLDSILDKYHEDVKEMNNENN